MAEVEACSDVAVLNDKLISVLMYQPHAKGMIALLHQRLAVLAEDTLASQPRRHVGGSL
jgi:hypothetical protein